MAEQVDGHEEIGPAFDRPPVGPQQELDLAVAVGLAFRRHRRDLTMTQRSYATFRGWSKGHQYRLESLAGDQRLDPLVQALAGTGFRLALVWEDPDACPTDVDVVAQEVRPDGERVGLMPPGGSPVGLVHPAEWGDTEFLARDNAGRRFPAHKGPYRPDWPPRWWWGRYATAGCDPPRWTTAGWHSPVEGRLDDPRLGSDQLGQG